MPRVSIRGMEDFLDKLPGLEKVLKALRHPLSLAGVLVVILFYFLPPNLLDDQPQEVKTNITYVFVGIIAIGFLILLLTPEPKKPAARNDGARFREWLASKDPELLAKWVIHESADGQEAEATPEQVDQVADAITALTEIEDAPPEMLTLALAKLEEGSTDNAEKLFEMVAEREGLPDDHRFEAFGHLGTLKYLHDTAGAEAAYSKALAIKPDDMNMLNRLAHVYDRKGELAKAEENYQKVLVLAQQADDSANQAVALGNLGILYQTKGELDKAEEMYRKSLAIHEALSRKEGLASNYGNLGLLHQTKGELDKAEEMYRKSLAIEEALGRKEGMASGYGNLGIVYKTKGELDKAEEMYCKALAINETLGSKEGMASDYGNLGILYYTKGELDKAEEMYRKSLAIEEALCRKEGMAKGYGNLGNLHQTKGELDKAEEMHRKSQAIEEALGRQEGMVSDYCNLGLLYDAKGDMTSARDYWQKARDLYAEVGMTHMVERVEGWLEEPVAAEKMEEGPQD